MVPSNVEQVTNFGVTKEFMFIPIKQTIDSKSEHFFQSPIEGGVGIRISESVPNRF